MKLLHLLSISLLLAPVAQAQVDFDIIYPSKVTVPPLGSSSSVGILVNTGTVPILRDEFDAALWATRTDQLTNGIDLDPVGANWTTLFPGQAVGFSPGGLGQELLTSTESLIPDTGAFNLRVASPTSENPLPPSTNVTTVLELNGKRVKWTQEFTFTGLDFQYSDFERAQGFDFPVPSITATALGCALPNGNSLTLELDDPFEFEDVPTFFGAQSNLPVLGNTAFDVRGAAPGLFELDGAPYVFVVRLDTGLQVFLDCVVPSLDGVIVLQTLGTLTEQTSPFGGTFMSTVNVPLPIPDEPALEGVALQIQWAALTTEAANGLFTTSPARRFVITSM